MKSIILLLTCSESQQKLAQLEDGAKASGKGKWAADADSHVRNIIWATENPRNFVDSQHGKRIPGELFFYSHHVCIAWVHFIHVVPISLTQRANISVSSVHFI